MYKSKVTFSVLSNVIICNQIIYLPWRMSGKNKKQQSFESSFRNHRITSIHSKIAEWQTNHISVKNKSHILTILSLTNRLKE